MENKLEDLIREDFKARTIQPSAGSFDVLSKKLRPEKRRGLRRGLVYLAYAAGISGLLLLGQFGFGDAAESKQLPVISDIEQKEPTTMPGSTHQDQLPLISLKEKEPEANSEKDGSKPIDHIIKARVQVKEEIVFSEKTELAGLDLPEEDSISIASVMEVERGPEGKTEISEEEIDALLASALKEVNHGKQDSLLIDSKKMLYELEVEINKPLPQKIMLTFISGAQTLKEIVNPKSEQNE